MNPLYFTYPLNALLMIALPIGLTIYLTRSFGLSWRLWWIGAAVFILSQVGHIPFNQWFFGLFETGAIQLPGPEWKMPLYAIFSGLSAGLWEELARYAAYRWWIKDVRDWKRGVLFGAGHGGCEAIILGVLVLITFFQLAALRGADLTQIVSADKVENLQQSMEIYWSADWKVTLLGAVERAFTIPFHIAASLLVLQTFIRKKFFWLGLAVAWHALIDTGIAGFAWPLLQGYAWGAYVVELLLGITALINIAIIFALRQPELPIPQQEEAPLPALSQPSISSDHEVTPEDLEKTRYNH